MLVRRQESACRFHASKGHRRCHFYNFIAMTLRRANWFIADI